MRTLALLWVLVVCAPLAAAEPGMVIDVEGGTFWVEYQGNHAPSAGTPVTVWTDVPGLDAPVPVCEGKVTGIEEGYIVVQRTGGEAAPRYGDLVRIGR